MNIEHVSVPRELEELVQEMADETNELLENGEVGMAEEVSFFATRLRNILSSATPSATSPPAAMVPDGWKLVPVEPNWDMRNEGREMLIDHCSKLDGDPERVAYVTWKAMIDASPQAGGKS